MAGRKRPSPPTGLSTVEPVLLADDEVFLAVARRGVHGAGAAFEGHVLAEDHGHDAIVERMPQAQVLERCALHAADFLRSGKARTLQHGRRQLARDQQCLDTAVDVVELRVWLTRSSE